MTNYLTQFQAQSKGRYKVNPELLERWEWDARWHGDTNIKTQASTAKRTATQLDNACQNFKHLAPEQELAFKAAASAMRGLAGDLAQLATWAKAYRTFCKVQIEKQRDQELEAIAAQRWGADEGVMKFEADIVEELATSDGVLMFANWVHASGAHKDVPFENIHPGVSGIHHAGKTLRQRMAATIEQAKRRDDHKWAGMHGLTVNCGWWLYEKYLAHRKEVAAAGARAVELAMARPV